MLLGPSGCGKSTLAQLHRRPARHHRRPDLHQGQERHLGGAQGPRHRHGVPVLRALSADDRAREPVLRPARTPACPRPRSTSASRAPPRSCRSSRCSTASPPQLSGGQRQRVAIGRALVRDVDVFLFDEPLSNLDAKLRSELRVEIKRLHQQLENTMIYVTHDQIEAMTLADRIAVMRGGVIQQLDDAADDLQPAGQPLRRRLHRLARHELHRGRSSSRRRPPAFRAGDIAVPLARYGYDGDGPAGRPASCSASGPSISRIGERRASLPFSQRGRGRDRRADGLRHPGLDQARRAEFRLPRRRGEDARTSASRA